MNIVKKISHFRSSNYTRAFIAELSRVVSSFTQSSPELDDFLLLFSVFRVENCFLRSRMYRTTFMKKITIFYKHKQERYFWGFMYVSQ